MILHKYRGDSSNTEQIFLKKSVWLSRPADLNDPFEGSLHDIDDTWRRDKVEEMKQAHLLGFLVSAKRGSEHGGFFDLTPLDTRRLLRKFKSFKTFQEKYSGFVDFFARKTGHPPSDPEALFPRLREQLAEVGIFSLSEVADHPLMWAHYAEQHRGLCIGFEVTDESVLADSERFLRVTYSDSIPKMGDGFLQQLTFSLDEDGRPRSGTQIAFSDQAMRAAVSTKSSDWAYEREWRYVEPCSGLRPWPGPLVELTFGFKCPQDRRDYYTRLVAENVPNEVRFYEIRKVPNGNSLERARLPNTSTARAIAQPLGMEALVLAVESRRNSEAIEISDHLLTSHADDAEFWRLRGLAFGQDADHLRALGCFERATHLAPHLFSSWYQTGVALTMLGRYDDATRAYVTAFAIQPEDPSLAFNLGLLSFQQERHQEADEYLRMAEKLGHPRARYMRDELEKAQNAI